MYVREYERPTEDAFAELEAVVGVKGRRFYGVFDEGAGGTGHVSGAARKTTLLASALKQGRSRAGCMHQHGCAATTMR